MADVKTGEFGDIRTPEQIFIKAMGKTEAAQMALAVTVEDDEIWFSYTGATYFEILGILDCIKDQLMRGGDDF